SPDHYKPNRNNPRPAHTAITCRPSDVNVIGGAQVSPPRPTYQSSFPVAASSANSEPPEAPNTTAPPVATSPPNDPPSRGERYSHCLVPVAASSARTTLVTGPTIDPPLPAIIPFPPRLTPRPIRPADFVKTDCPSIACTKINPRAGSKALGCQFTP